MARLFLSHQTALSVYRNPEVCRRLVLPALERGNVGRFDFGCSLVGTHPVGNETDQRPDVRTGRPAEDLAQLRALLSIPPSQPIHLLVPEARMRRNSLQTCCHTWSDYPSARFIRIADGIHVSTPALVYRQILGAGDFENRLMLASELTGNYAPDATRANGIVKRPPLSTIEQLTEELEAARPFMGAEGLLLALRYTLPNANSPKEAQLGALLGLPRKMGGQGLRVAGLNLEIPLSGEARTIARRHHLVADVYIMHEENWRELCQGRHATGDRSWPSQTAPPVVGAQAMQGDRRAPTFRDRDTEYDSDAEHLTAQMNESDKRRTNALACMDIDVTSITKGQLHSWQTFLAIAGRLAIDMESRLKPANETMLDRQYALWRRLLFGKMASGRIVMPDGAPAELRPRW